MVISVAHPPIAIPFDYHHHSSTSFVASKLAGYFFRRRRRHRTTHKSIRRGNKFPEAVNGPIRNLGELIAKS